MAGSLIALDVMGGDDAPLAKRDSFRGRRHDAIGGDGAPDRSDPLAVRHEHDQHGGGRFERARVRSPPLEALRENALGGRPHGAGDRDGTEAQDGGSAHDDPLRQARGAG